MLATSNKCFQACSYAPNRDLFLFIEMGACITIFFFCLCLSQLTYTDAFSINPRFLSPTETVGHVVERKKEKKQVVRKRKHSFNNHFVLWHIYLFNSPIPPTHTHTLYHHHGKRQQLTCQANYLPRGITFHALVFCSTTAQREKKDFKYTQIWTAGLRFNEDCLRQTLGPHYDSCTLACREATAEITLSPKEKEQKKKETKKKN